MKPSVVASHLWHGLSFAFMAALLAFVPACGGEKPTGTVKGVVKFKGELVKGGTVNFFSSERGTGVEVKIEEAGTFESKAPIEIGKYKIFVNPPRPEQLPPGSKVQPKPAFPPIAPKYQDPGQTPLTAEIKVGVNEIPVEIPAN